MRRKFNSSVDGAIGVAAVGVIAVVGGVSNATMTAGSWTVTTITAPTGNVLEAINVGNTTSNDQEQFEPIVSSTYAYDTYFANLSNGTYTFSLDMEVLAKPSQYYFYMRGVNGGTTVSLPAFPTLATNQWYNISISITGSNTNDFEIGLTNYGHSPAITSEVLYDNISVTNSNDQQILAFNPISFAGDTAGKAPPSSQITGSNFTTLDVLAVPEPATLALMAAMGAGLLLIGRKRKVA